MKPNGRNPFDFDGSDEPTKPDSRPTIIILKQLHHDMDAMKQKIEVIMKANEDHLKEMAGFMRTVLNKVGEVQVDIKVLINRVNELELRVEKIERTSTIPAPPAE